MTGTEAMKALEESKLAANVAGEVARILMSGMQCPRFGPGAPTVPEVAAIIGKDATWIREGIENGWFPIGICSTGSKGNRSFYVSPKMLWEVTGYVWEGRK